MRPLVTKLHILFPNTGVSKRKAIFKKLRCSGVSTANVLVPVFHQQPTAARCVWSLNMSRPFSTIALSCKQSYIYNHLPSVLVYVVFICVLHIRYVLPKVP